MDYLKDKVGGILPGVITNKSEKSLPPPKEVLPSPPKEKKSDEKAAGLCSKYSKLLRDADRIRTF